MLAKILDSKKREVEALHHATIARAVRTTLDVPVALKSPRALKLIAEIKKKSPSAGPLSSKMSVAERASAYAHGGAAMISVLCDGPFFDGGWDDLAAARAHLDAQGHEIPLLAKEFVIDEIQIAKAHASGADAVLLIARIVSADRLDTLAKRARAAGLEPFVEIVDDAELEVARSIGARVIGVNARDLDTLAIDPARSSRLLAQIAAADDRSISVHLSGIKTPADVKNLANTRVDAALIGEVLMREDDPQSLLASLVRASSRA